MNCSWLLYIYMICYIKNVQNIKCIQTNVSQTFFFVVNNMYSLRCIAGSLVHGKIWWVFIRCAKTVELRLLIDYSSQQSPTASGCYWLL
ncbi:hypothetical protein XELAEV_18017572mg [Xenopus laevis]|uniref:Uncharacterized protein n=1 Tax=Xenopus laevis TaxID=8355 RepID=A0A974HSU3_XENLA|nr:hypothetical protein XELAEV_18017572mg [Xenopus laevis]